MAQDKESGLAASRYGRRCARQIAKAIGAEMVGNKSNECVWNGQLVVIKTAHSHTTSVGVLYHMVERIKAVLGAFEEKGGSYRVIQLPIARCASVMRPTRSQGPSAGRVGMIDRKVFEDEGQLVGIVKIETP